MNCKDCEARAELAREAWLKKNFAEAAGHVIKGAAEVFGLKEKTGEAELIEKDLADRKESRRDRFTAP